MFGAGSAKAATPTETQAAAAPAAVAPVVVEAPQPVAEQAPVAAQVVPPVAIPGPQPAPDFTPEPNPAKDGRNCLAEGCQDATAAVRCLTGETNPTTGEAFFLVTGKVEAERNNIQGCTPVS